MPQDPTNAESGPRPRKRRRVGGHAPGPEGAPLCGATPQDLRFSDPPTCSQCASVLAKQAGKVTKKKNRVKGKHAKGPEGKPLCGVEAKKAHFAKSPTCVKCRAALGLGEAEEPSAKDKAKAKPQAPAQDCVACLKRDLKAARSNLDASSGGAAALIAGLEERLAAIKGTKGAKARRLSCRRCREEKRESKERARAAKKADWVFVTCPVCEASVPEHRLGRHMRKVHPDD